MTTPICLPSQDPIRRGLMARALRGARLLDRRNPGWRSRVDRDQLFQNSCDRCVLGQLYLYYSRGLTRVAPAVMAGRHWTDLKLHAWSAANGFTLGPEEQGLTPANESTLWVTLTACWRDIIRHGLRSGRS